MTQSREEQLRAAVARWRRISDHHFNRYSNAPDPADRRDFGLSDAYVTCANELEAILSQPEPSAAPLDEPWAYAIETPGGDMYDGEYAVFGDEHSCRDQVENLNDDLEETEEQYKVVALYRAPAASEPSATPLSSIIQKLREDAHQYRSPFYTMTPHVDEDERDYRAKMLEEIASELERIAPSAPAEVTAEPTLESLKTTHPELYKVFDSALHDVIVILHKHNQQMLFEAQKEHEKQMASMVAQPGETAAPLDGELGYTPEGHPTEAQHAKNMAEFEKPSAPAEVTAEREADWWHREWHRATGIPCDGSEQFCPKVKHERR